MPRSIWSTPPTQRIYNLAVRSLGLSDENSINWFDSSNLVESLRAELLQELRPFYYKCMAKRYIDKENMTYKEYLVIVRQILRHFNRGLERREKCVKVEDQLYRYYPQYRLKPVASTGVVTFQ